MSRYSNQTTVKISGHIARTTEKAILINAQEVNGTKIYPDDEHKTKAIWFPKSQVMKSLKSPVPGELDYIQVMEWIAVKTKEIEDALRESKSATSRQAKQDLQGNPNFSGKDSVPYRGTNGGYSRENDEGYNYDYQDGEYE